MSKKADRIITSVYLTKEMCGQIDKLADREHISRNEQIRRFIKKGLTVDGYTEDIDFIASIIRQEFTAVYHIGDIKAVVEQQTNRLAKMLMKSGKMDAAAFFLLIKVLMNVAHDGTQDEFDQMWNEAVTKKGRPNHHIGLSDKRNVEILSLHTVHAQRDGLIQQLFAGHGHSPFLCG